MVPARAVEREKHGGTGRRTELVVGGLAAVDGVDVESPNTEAVLSNFAHREAVGSAAGNMEVV
jgi:hypothetical protein